MTNWSVSRDQTLHQCERRYFFQYLAAAKINSRDPVLHQIAFLKKLSNLHLWKGNVFHSEIARILKNLKAGIKLSRGEIINRVQNRMTTEWNFSNSLSFRDNPSAIDKPGGLALFEHEYSEDMDSDLGSVILEVSESILNLIEWFDVSNLVDKLVEATTVWIEPPTYGPNAPGFFLDNVQVVTKVDLALHQRNGEFQIFDWKTGKQPEKLVDRMGDSEFQICIYLLWPHITLGIPLDAIHGHLVYLGDKPIKQSFSIDENQREIVLAMARRSIARAIHFEELRKKMGMQLTDLDFADQTWLCKRCNFKRLCKEAVYNDKQH